MGLRYELKYADGDLCRLVQEFFDLIIQLQDGQGETCHLKGCKELGVNLII